MKNLYSIDGEVVTIQIQNKGEILPCLIDLKDLPLIDSFPQTWKYSGGYAKITTTIAGQWVSYDMHRVIYGAIDPGNVVDHRNLDTLDNRRVNLQQLSRGKNAGKQKPRSTSKSGMPGVHIHRDKWRVLLKVNGRNIWGGDYQDLEIAKRRCVALRVQHCPHTVIRKPIKLGDH